MWSGQAWQALPHYTGDPYNSEDEDDWLGRYKRAISMNSLVQSGLIVNEGLFILDGVCHTCLLSIAVDCGPDVSRALALCSHLIRPHTKNAASSGNVTRVQGVRMKLQHGLLW
jgi:hypothetical protein